MAMPQAFLRLAWGGMENGQLVGISPLELGSKKAIVAGTVKAVTFSTQANL